MMTLKPFVLALAAAQGRDLFAPASVQQPQAFLAPAQPVAYGAPQYVVVEPTYVASAGPAGVSTGSAMVIVAAAAVAGAAVGMAMRSSERDVATLAVEGRDVNRRALLAAAAAAASLPFAARADENEDAIARIARKNAENNEKAKAAERAKYQKTDDDIEREQQQSKNLILGIAGVGTLASGAFIIPNLTRLATKVASGGKDAGYATKGKVRGKKQPEFKEKSFGEKLFSAAFARDSSK